MIFITIIIRNVHQNTSYLQHKFARPIIGHHREVVQVLNEDLVSQNIAAVLGALVH